MSDNALDLVGLDVAHTKFDTDGGAAHLPLVEFVAGVVRVRIVKGNSKTGTLQLSDNFVSFVSDHSSVITRFLDWNDHKLDFSDLRRKHKTLVI